MKTKTAKGAAGATKATGPLSTAAFIKSLVKAGKLDDKQILAAAQKRAPKQKIKPHYVSWYRWQMNQKGGGYRGGGKKVRRRAAEE